MRVSVISSRGDSVTIARKLQQENHTVQMYVRDKLFRRFIEPDVPMIKAPTIEMVGADLILVEDSEAGKFVDKARALNRLVVGGGTIADKLINDIDFNERSLHGCGLTLSEPQTEGMVIEIGGWFDGEKYLRPHFMGFKSYRLGTGDVGPPTVCMGMVGMYKIKSRLFTDILHRTETLLKSMHYLGYASIEGFINNNSFKAAKLHARLQFPTVNLLGELHPAWGPFLFKLCTHKSEVVAVQPDRIAVGVTVLMHGHFNNDGQEPYRFYMASGQTLEEAKSKAYKSVSRSDIPHGYYRIDIGNDFTKNLEKLKEGDWI